jgi:hypothetical protein
VIALGRCQSDNINPITITIANCTVYLKFYFGLCCIEHKTK